MALRRYDGGYDGWFIKDDLEWINDLGRKYQARIDLAEVKVAKPAIPTEYTPEVAADMLACAKLHAKMSPASLLGGAILSWASGQKANDWDLYVSDSMADVLRETGYTFMKEKNVKDDGYGKKVVYGWIVTEKPVFGSEQMILIPERELDDIWKTFDYFHCMLGVDRYNEVVKHGLLYVANGTLQPNRDGCKRVRSSAEIRKKLEGKIAFGAGQAGQDRVLLTLELYKSILEDEMAEQGTKHEQREVKAKANSIFDDYF